MPGPLNHAAQAFPRFHTLAAAVPLTRHTFPCVTHRQPPQTVVWRIPGLPLALSRTAQATPPLPHTPWACSPTHSTRLDKHGYLSDGTSGAQDVGDPRCGSKALPPCSCVAALTRAREQRRSKGQEQTFSDIPGGAVGRNLPGKAGTRVRSPVREDPTCPGATEARVSPLPKPVLPEPMLCKQMPPG